MSSRALRLLLAVFVLLAAGWMFNDPFRANDTDLFYHLSAGRYLADTGSPPSGSYFSYLKPERPFTDYYWLFQGLVFAVHKVGGFVGLLGLRSLLFVALLSLVAGLLFSRARPGPTSIYLLGVFGLFTVIVYERFANLRPHCMSFLLLAATLAVLESSSRRALYWLPVISILWANFHGVEYPVFLVCLGGAAAGMFWQAFQSRTLGSEARRRLAILSVSALGLLATPLGVRLLPVPFKWSSLASQYVMELKPLAASDLLEVSFSGGLLTLSNALFLFVLLVLVSLARAAGRRQFEVAHLVWLAGGVLLMSRGIRLTFEFALLALPLVRSQAPFEESSWSKRWQWVLAGLLLAWPLVSVTSAMGARTRYPVARSQLPEGNVAFLRAVDTGGKVMNAPGRGGYLAWELYPRYQIASDTETPFIFDELDTFFGVNAFQEPAAFESWLNEGPADYLMVPLVAQRFPEIAELYPRFRPVFFDDTSVLYADVERHPELARQYDLAPLAPFSLLAGSFWDQPLEDGQAAALEPVVQRMLAIDRGGLFLNALGFALARHRADAQAALRHAEVAVETTPESFLGHELRGQALFALGRVAESALAYEDAIQRCPEERKEELWRRLGHCFLQLERWEPAYRALREGVKPYTAYVQFDDLEALATAAQKTGHSKEAEIYRRMAEVRRPPEPR